MKLIEAINQAKSLERQSIDLKEEVRKKAAKPSFRVNGPTNDRKEIEIAISEYRALLKKIAELKRAIDYTNICATVDVDGSKYSLHDLIIHKRHSEREIWDMLDDTVAQKEVDELRKRSADPSKATASVVRNYDPEAKRKSLKELNDRESKMDSALQIANARVDLMMPPTME